MAPFCSRMAFVAMVVLWDETLYGSGRLPRQLQHVGNALSYSLHQIVGCGWHFREEQALLIMQADDIGERATNVNGDLDHG
jgi:hypothetical protein